MRHIAATVLLILGLSHTISAIEQPDILGSEFSQEHFDMGHDYSGSVRSTIVRALPIVEGRDAVLYIHGFNDYFFQREMAQHFRDSSYNFYAVDLRRYGRSLVEGERAFEVRDLSEYFADIDNAIEVIRREGAQRLVLMGHSTGGLIASYYLGEGRNRYPVDALILNSPFFALNVGYATQYIATPIIAALGGLFPTFEFMQDKSTHYYDSLHADSRGEWHYDTTLKMRESPPITMGWIRAIHAAQNSLQSGYDIDIPILVLHSDKSFNAEKWSEEITRSDIVLNVEHIKKYGATLGEDVTIAPINGALHDVTLSAHDVRSEAYKIIFDWLTKALSGR